MKKSKVKILCLLVVAMFLCSACTSEQENKEVTTTSSKKTVRVGTNLALGTVAPYVAKEKGYFDESSMNVKVVEFSDGSSLMEAFAAGELDMAFVGIAPVATWESKGVGLKIIASANGGGHVVLTRKDTGITSMEELRGKKIAEPNISTVTDALLRDKILVDVNLTPEDITAVSGLKPADMPAVLELAKEVDAIITWEPYASQAESAYDDIVVVYDAAKVIQEQTQKETYYPVNVLIASDDFIKNHSDIITEFITIYKKTVDFINNDPSANTVLAKVLQLDEAVIANARKRVDFNYYLDTESFNSTLQWSYDLGYLKEMPKDEDLYNLSFLGKE